MKKLYLAGGLFNAGERLHNLYLEKHLKTLGYTVILPQREALKFLRNDVLDLHSVVASCQGHCLDPNNLYVGACEGSDADSGTAVEFGIAITKTGKAIIYRTDVRTALEKEVGVNAMFKVWGTPFVFHPCFFTELSEVDNYYQELALKIHQVIESLKK